MAYLKIICAQCGEPARTIKPQTLCAKCRNKLMQNERRREYIDAGICPSCGRRPLAEGMHRCERCLERYRQNRKTYYLTNIALHRCPRCGVKNPDYALHTFCPKCRAYHSKHNKMSYNKRTDKNHEQTAKA